MSQITIYLDDKLESKVRRRAKVEGVSVSKWIAGKVAVGERDTWPPEVLASFGTWNDVPDLKSIRSNFEKDSRRMKLG